MQSSALTCLNKQQLPLYIGDGITADFSIRAIDVSSDLSLMMFGATGYVNSTGFTGPIIGAFAINSYFQSLTWMI